MLSVTCLHIKVVTENTRAPVLSNFKVALYSFAIAHMLRMKAQVICTRAKEKASVFPIFYDVNMSTKSKLNFLW